MRLYEISKKAAQTSGGENEPKEDKATAPKTNNEARVLTFAELQNLIESGKVDQIPNNKVIPEGLNVSTFLFLLADISLTLY